MKKKISFTATLEWEVDDEYLEPGEDYKTFDEIEDSDYDNVGRPINHLEDLGWTITKKKVTPIE